MTRFSEEWYARRVGAAQRKPIEPTPEQPIVKRAKPPQAYGAPLFPGMCVAAGYPKPVIEHQFHPVRKWQFDFAWPDRKIAVEQEGGIWRKGGGAHSHPLNIERDIAKYNAAALLGWRILRYAPEDMELAIIDLRGAFK